LREEEGSSYLRALLLKLFVFGTARGQTFPRLVRLTTTAVNWRRCSRKKGQVLHEMTRGFKLRRFTVDDMLALRAHRWVEKRRDEE
jgi:hypothetical protein